jgi:hypothetical protein
MKGADMRTPATNGGVELIVYEGEIVATVGARRMYLAGHVRELDDADPLLFFVSLMGAYALHLRDDPTLGPYTDERAERFARCVLIDDEAFRMLDANELDDRLLAGHFDVPVEQVMKKRDDLRQFG